MDNMKKEFQKMVKVWRENYSIAMETKGEACRGDYPKANMNEAQQRKNTATINCYGVKKEFIDAMMASPIMADFLAKYNAKASLEYKVESAYTKFWQIRINY